MDKHYADITAVMKRYYDGLFHGDVATLQSVFHPQAQYATVSAGALLHFNMAEYMGVVENRASPADRGDDYSYSIDAIRLAGPTTASVELTCAMLGKRYTDFLSLLFLDGEWRIMAKIFHAEDLLN